MGRTYAGILGPLAFTVILARSLIGGGSLDATLMFATACLFLFAALGYVAGSIAEAIVLEAVKARFDKELKGREAGARAE